MQGFWLICGHCVGFLAVRCIGLHVAARPWADRRSAHPSFGVSEAKDPNPERKNAPRERTVLCEMWYRADLVVRWSCAGLTRASIFFARSLYEEGWIAGSSPAMTAV